MVTLSIVETPLMCKRSGVLSDRRAAVAWGLLVVFCAVAMAGCTSKGSQPTARKGEGGVPVTVALATRRDVPLQIEVIGNVEAYSTITVKAQVGGEITQVHFREGEYVKAGDLLFTIDTRPLNAMLNEVEANLAKDEAALGQA